MSEQIAPICTAGTLSRNGPQPEERRKIFSDGLWVVVGQVASAFFLLAGTRLITEFVPPHTFGSVSLLIGLVTLGSGVLCKPHIHAAVRFFPDCVSDGRVDKLCRVIQGRLFSTTLTLSVVTLGTGFFASLYSGISFVAFVCLAALVAAEVYRAFETSLLGAARKQRSFALWVSFEQMLRPLAAVLIILAFGASEQAILLGYLAATCVVLLVCRALFSNLDGTDSQANEIETDNASETHELAADIRRFARPLMPVAIIAWVSSLGDRYLLYGLLDLKSVGIYAIVYSLMSRPFLMLGNSILLTMRPLYFDAIASGDEQLAARRFRQWLLATAAVSSCGVIGAFLLSDWIAVLTLSEGYRAAANLMPWIALGHAFLITSYVFEGTCYAYKMTQWIGPIQLTGAVATLVVGGPLIYAFELFGAAIAVPIYMGLQLLAAIAARHSMLRSFSRKFDPVTGITTTGLAA